MFFGIVLILVCLNFYNNNLLRFGTNLVSNAFYKYTAISYSDDHFTDAVVRQCGVFSGDDEIKCVVNEVSGRYNYTMHNKTIKPPSEFVETGGVCRDIAITYDIIFTKLGYRTGYVFDVPEHVFNEITNSETFCYIDGYNWECW
jgi:hypothetical protein